MSFLVSTPETGIDSIAVTYALINPAMAVLRPLAAFVSAVISGLLVEGFSARTGNATSKTVESCGVCGEDDCEKNHSWAARLSASFRYVLNDFFPDIANWLVVGLIISGILAAVLPNDLLVGTGSLPQMAMTILIGVPLYICASASTPIAAILLSKGMTPGAALVFLLVGPATNAASLILIARLLGRWIAVLYLAGVVLSSVAIGLTANAALGHVDWTPRIADPELIEHLGIFHWLGLALLTAALIRVWQRQLDRWRNRRGPRAADAIA